MCYFHAYQACHNSDLEAQEDSLSDQRQTSASILDSSAYTKFSLVNSSSNFDTREHGNNNMLERKRGKSRLKFTPSKSWKHIEERTKIHRKFSIHSFALTKPRSIFHDGSKCDKNKLMYRKSAISAYKHTDSGKKAEQSSLDVINQTGSPELIPHRIKKKKLKLLQSRLSTGKLI